MKPYPKYKESGVEWLGDLPEGWEIRRFRFVFRESDEKIESVVFGEMLSVSGYRGIEIKEYDDENRKRRDEELVGYRIVRRGQLVINSMWLNYAGLGVSDFEGHVSPAYRAYNFLCSCERRYIHHLMRSAAYVSGYTKHLTGIRPNSLQMSKQDLMSFPILLPPLPEQRAIAAFLDREVAKIDELIAEQERLIELLAEKRQATISHAVTKGLDPNAKLKPSGVEWLGDVPEDWEVVRMRYLCSANDETLPEDAAPSTMISYVEISDVSEIKGITNQTEMEFKNAPSRARRIAREGDVLVSTVRTYLRAITAVREPPPCLIVSTGFAVLRSKGLIASDFLGLLLKSEYFVAEIISRSVGISYPSVTVKEMLSVTLPLPSKPVQREIADHLLSIDGSLKTLTTAAQESIALLRERRSSLISAAVTGKIDVRDLVPAAAEAV